MFEMSDRLLVLILVVILVCAGVVFSVHYALFLFASRVIWGESGGGAGAGTDQQRYVLYVALFVIPGALLYVWIVLSEAMQFAERARKKAEKNEAEIQRRRLEIALKEAREAESAQRAQERLFVRRQRLEASRVHQATRLFASPPIFGHLDERRNNYGLVHLATTATKRRLLDAIVHFLLPSEGAHLQQTRKVFPAAVETAMEQVVHYIHHTQFALVPPPTPFGRLAIAAAEVCLTTAEAVREAQNRKSRAPRRQQMLRERGEEGAQRIFSWLRTLHIYAEPRKPKWPLKWEALDDLVREEDRRCFYMSCTRYLHEHVKNMSLRIMIMGGQEVDSYGDYRDSNLVFLMHIDHEGAQVSWRTCPSMIKRQNYHACVFVKGQVLSIGSKRNNDDYTFGDEIGVGSCERYDVLSGTSVLLKQKLPIRDLESVASAELNGKVYLIGGLFRAPAPAASAALVGEHDGDENDEDQDEGELKVSDRVFCLDLNKHKGGRSGAWVEHPSRLPMPRRDGTAVFFQGNLWLAGGYNDKYGRMQSIEVFNPNVGSWQVATHTFSKDRASGHLQLMVIKDDLYAAGHEDDASWVEKLDQQSGEWHLVSELKGQNRRSCQVVACGTCIYFIGGTDIKKENGFDEAKHSIVKCSWNSFDTHTHTWASEDKGGAFKQEEAREVPWQDDGFVSGRAVCIAQEVTWTSYPDFTNRRDEEDEENEEQEGAL